MKVELGDVVKILSAITTALLAGAELVKQVNQFKMLKNTSTETKSRDNIAGNHNENND